MTLTEAEMIIQNWAEYPKHKLMEVAKTFTTRYKDVCILLLEHYTDEEIEAAINRRIKKDEVSS